MESALDRLLADAQRPPAADLLRSERAGPPSYSLRALGYDELISILIANPFETHKAVAAKLGRTEQWLARIIASDAFQVRLAERVEKDVDPMLQAAVKTAFGEIEARAKATLSRCLQLMSDRLDRPDEEVSDQQLVKFTELAAKIAKVGEEAQAPTVNLHLHLRQLGDNMVRILRSARADLEGEAHELTTDAPTAPA